MSGLIRPPPGQAASGSTRPKAGSSRERVDPATTGPSRERIKPREARLPRPRIDSTARGPIHDFILPDGSSETREAPAAARRARGTRTDTRRARAPGAGHPEMCDADGEIYLFTCTRGYVTPPPPRPRTATLGRWGTPPSPHSTTTRTHETGTTTYVFAQQCPQVQAKAAPSVRTPLDLSRREQRPRRDTGERRVHARVDAPGVLATPTHCGL